MAVEEMLPTGRDRLMALATCLPRSQVISVQNPSHLHLKGMICARHEAAHGLGHLNCEKRRRWLYGSFSCNGALRAHLSRPMIAK